MMKTVALLLALAASSLAAPKIVLVAGTPSHPAGEHEFNAGVTILAKLLSQNDVEPVIVRGGWPEDVKVFDDAKSIVFYMDGGAKHPVIQEDRLSILQKLMDKGVGIACLHYAVEVPKDKGGPEFLKWIGGYYETGYSTNPHNTALVHLETPNHPISRGVKDFEINDEWYYRIRFAEPADKRVTPILTTMLPKDAPNKEVVAWVREREDKGRGFGFTGAHWHKNWANADFRRLVTNAILWTAKVNVPKNGAKVDIDPVDLEKNLDPGKKPRTKPV
ncbi:MAG TPA: ThuA domain-containing protein [Bryobacteraceae bacterium]|jgi:type 1 glutamine amidotransferase|nr:ThuA domain-containing protein [Bryobacteraceae bacterium]